MLDINEKLKRFSTISNFQFNKHMYLLPGKEHKQRPISLLFYTLHVCITSVTLCEQNTRAACNKMACEALAADSFHSNDYLCTLYRVRNRIGMESFEPVIASAPDALLL